MGLRGPASGQILGDFSSPAVNNDTGFPWQTSLGKVTFSPHTNWAPSLSISVPRGSCRQGPRSLCWPCSGRLAFRAQLSPFLGLCLGTAVKGPDLPSPSLRVRQTTRASCLGFIHSEMIPMSAPDPSLAAIPQQGWGVRVGGGRVGQRWRTGEPMPLPGFAPRLYYPSE